MTNTQAGTRLGLRFGGDVLAAALLAAAPLAVYASAGIALLAVLAAVAIVALAAFDRRWPALGAKALLAALAIAVVWGAFSALWSIRPGESLRRALQLLGIFLAGGILLGAAQELDERQRRRVALAAAAGIALALALIFFERLSGGALRRLLDPGFDGPSSTMNRASTLLVALLAGPACWLWRKDRRLAVAALALGVAAATVALDSAAARLGWAAGAIASVLAWYWPRAAAALAAAAIAAAFLLAPLAPRFLPVPDPARIETRQHLPGSAAHRLILWNYAAGKVAERPLLGHGLDTARSLPDAREVLTWDMGPQPPGAPRYTAIVLMPLHPHNVPLQLWLELGLPGALLGGAVALLALAAAAAMPDRAARAAGIGLIAACVAIANVGYGAWQSWWLLALFLAAAGFAASAGADGRIVRV